MTGTAAATYEAVLLDRAAEKVRGAGRSRRRSIALGRAGRATGFLGGWGRGIGRRAGQ